MHPNASTEPKESKDPLIRRGRVASVDLYEIKDSELDLLERGSPADLQLNFAIFLISTAFGAICSLATADFKNTKIETVFLLVAIVGILLGAYLLIAWFRNRSSVKVVCKQIRERIPKELGTNGIPPGAGRVPSEKDTSPEG